MATLRPSAATPASSALNSSSFSENTESGSSTINTSTMNNITEASPSSINTNNKKGKEANSSGFGPPTAPELESPDHSRRQLSPEDGALTFETYVVHPVYPPNTSTNCSNETGFRSTVTHHIVRTAKRAERRVVLIMDVSRIVRGEAFHGFTANIVSYISIHDNGEPRPALTAGNATDTAVGGLMAANTTPGFTSPEELVRLAPAERLRAIKVNEAIAKASNTKVANQKPAGFCDLSLELRHIIYKEAFVAGGPIDFQSRERFANSAQFLRTCRMIHEEGKPFLYGENVFHFERTHERRGSFFNRLWEEFGWKDIRYFLETIGPKNLGLMRRISFVLSDSYLSSTPNLDPEIRRFVHQSTVHQCLNILGHHATNLEKVSMCISGRRILEVTDFNLIRALTSIQADVVHNSNQQRTTLHSNIRGGLLDTILLAMTKHTNMTAAEKQADANRKYTSHPVRMYCEVGECVGCRS